MIVIVISTGFIIIFAFFEVLLSLALMGSSKPFPGRIKQSYTVVVAARNEKDKIAGCITALLKQRHLPDKIIVADDHSNDFTLSVVQKMSLENPLIMPLSCDESEQGKRAAIFKGLMSATTDIVLTTDADCEVKPSWAQAMIECLNEERRMVSGPVITNAKSFRQSLEYAESLFLVSTGAGVAWFGRMFQSSGANMAFYKEDFKAFFLSAQGDKYHCGDDVFFLQYLQSQYGRKSTEFCSSAAAVVTTEACSSTNDWIAQRIRWAGKSKGYNETTPFIIGGLVALSNIVTLLAAVYIFIMPELRFFLIPGIIVKIMGDFSLTATASIAWKSRFRMAVFLIMPALYPFFMLRVGLGLVFRKEKTWKGRKIR